MTGANDKFGDIKVEMGDSNEVGHIGHKITFNAPPPPPNGLYQDGTLAGEFEGEPVLIDGCYSFSKLFVEPNFNASSQFEIQGVKLLVEQVEIDSSISLGGRPPIRSLCGVVCRII